MPGLIITGVEKSDGMEIYFYGSGQQGFVAQLALLVYDYVLAVMGLLPLLYDLTWPDLMASGKEFRHRPAGPRQAERPTDDIQLAPKSNVLSSEARYYTSNYYYSSGDRRA